MYLLSVSIRYDALGPGAHADQVSLCIIDARNTGSGIRITIPLLTSDTYSDDRISAKPDDCIIERYAP
eukprot:scaffold105546_cov17-Prasinocladus_malaysianus.AAC.1